MEGWTESCPARSAWYKVSVSGFLVRPQCRVCDHGDGRCLCTSCSSPHTLLWSGSPSGACSPGRQTLTLAPPRHQAPVPLPRLHPAFSLQEPVRADSIVTPSGHALALTRPSVAWPQRMLGVSGVEGRPRGL